MKLYVSGRVMSVTDPRLQLHGGYGYITEGPIERACLAVRLLSIFGGTSEIMREVVGRQLAATKETMK